MTQKVADIRVGTREGVDPTALERQLTVMRTALNAVIDSPLTSGNHIEKVVINDGGITRVPHKLGRKPLGWFVTRTRYRGAEVFESAQQTITSSGTVSFAHGLGGAPLLVVPHLVCLTAEDGYEVGDLVYPFSIQHSTAERGVSIGADSTNIVAAYGSAAVVFEAQPETGGAAVSLTNANFSLVVRAWRERRLIDQQASETSPEMFLRLLGSGFLDDESLDLWIF